MIAVDAAVEPMPTSGSRSTSTTWRPRWARCHAVEQPTMPPPTTIASHTGGMSVTRRLAAGHQAHVRLRPPLAPQEGDHRRGAEERAEREGGLTVADAARHEHGAPHG